jgi:hypothetical protein
MNESQAWGILAYLSGFYPREPLDDIQSALFREEVEKLPDAEAGYAAAQGIVRTLDHFPTVRQFREAYFATIRARGDANAEARGLSALVEKDIPTWAHVWWWCRHDRDPIETRGFPQQADVTGNPLIQPTMTADEYAALEQEWRAAGEPKLHDLLAA